MQYTQLGSSSLRVSKLCLGTMMMGSQTSKRESKQIMSAACEAGINFFDTAEMYSIPPNTETQGNSERYIGEWLKERGKRDDIIIATKVTGRSQMHWIRGYKDPSVELCLNAANINHAIDNSLRRLQTDYIDLYQIHWPDRPLPLFGSKHNEASLDNPEYISITETLHALAELIKAGKIRHIGISNENLNGVREYLRLSAQAGLPNIATIQNAYSLVNREFEDGLADYCQQHRVGLLPYSILAMGYLTGKYLAGKVPEGTRKALFNNLSRYNKLADDHIVERYKSIADSIGLTLNELAHAFVYQQPFVDATIIAANTRAQLAENIKAYGIELAPETNAAIDKVHQQEPSPCP